MSIIGIIGSIILGGVSGKLLAQSWLSFISAIVGLIGVIRCKQIAVNLAQSGLHLVTCAFFSLLLWGVDYANARWIGLGYTTGETVIFWITALFSFVFMIPQMILRVKEVWKMAMNSGYLEKKIRSTKNI